MKMRKLIFNILIFVVAGVFSLLPFQAQKINASTLGLSGYAWSDVPQVGERGAGWISFSGPTYGVFVDSDTGVMSGYAWSEHYGWLSFNDGSISGFDDLIGCPVGFGPCIAKIDISAGTASARPLTGWAKFVNGSPTGSYQGWVKLGGYGAIYNSFDQKFYGYSWGSDLVGWISWKGLTYGVITSNAPVGTLSVNTCTIAGGASTCNSQVTWTTANRIPGANTAVTRNNPANTTVSTATSGTNVNDIVNHGVSTYFLYHNGAEIAPSVPINVNCALGFTWNGITCAGSGGNMSGTLGPTIPSNTSCTIPNGASTCTINFDWSVINPEVALGSAVTSSITDNGTPQSNTRVDPILPATYDSNSNVPFVVPHNTRTFYLYNNGVKLSPPGEVTVSSSCAAGAWNGSICVSMPTVTLTANPLSIPPPPSTLTWFSTNSIACTASANPADSNWDDLNKPLSGSVQVSPAITTTYAISCNNGSVQASDNKTVTVGGAGKKPIFKED